MNKIAFAATLITAFLLVSFYMPSETQKNEVPKLSGEPFIGHYYPNLKDTFYTYEDCYIEINLTTQSAVLRTRTGYVKPFDISSGTDRLLDGVNTKPGLFVIQSMQHKWHSRQFDSTLMLYWMGFNYGIGFHGLATNGYYRHLGVRPSSHGCVRIAREDGAEIYDIVTLHSPVLVYMDKPAVAIGFADSASGYTQYDFWTMREIMEDRFNLLYKGEYLLYEPEKLVIRRENVTHNGLPIGEGDKVSKRQTVYTLFQDYLPETVDKYSLLHNNVFLPDSVDSVSLLTYGALLDSLQLD